MKKFPNAERDNAPLPRRLAAICYDSLIVATLWFVIGAIGVALNGGEAAQGPFFNSALFLITFCFFALFWTRNGQTLGMQAWRLRVQNNEGYPINLTQAMLRFFIAIISALCLGLGYLWMLFGKSHLTWQDRYSDSRIVVVPKGKKH
jgi:uncharacterized RDD family membrane protein YckC